MKKARLIREQIDAKLHEIAPLKTSLVPSKGWIRALRTAMSMSARQLGRRIGLGQQAIDRTEKSEASGTVTFKSMRKLAEGLDCVFIYAIVPRTTVEDAMRRQARKLARARLDQVSHSMALEDQALSESENNSILASMTDDILDNPPPDLWDEA